VKETLKGIFYKLGENILRTFSGKNFLWQMLAIILTLVLVLSGFDWKYYSLFHHGSVFYFFILAPVLGFIVPILVPLYFLIKGIKDKKAKIIGFALTQAVFLGWCVSAFYKALTGRAHPEPFTTSLTDITKIFQFGFGRGGVFWGWPSSHTTVAFAFSMALIALFPHSKKVKLVAIIYALYIGLGVSVSIHWFSDFVAGAIFGAIVGITVGKSFKKLA
jgi:membrane-associated phospholipid phosphatase